MSIGEPDLRIKRVKGVYSVTKDQRIEALETETRRLNIVVAHLVERVTALEGDAPWPGPFKDDDHNEGERPEGVER